MSPDSTKRQPAGIPTGGQFASHDRAEAGIDLLERIDVDLMVRLENEPSGYLAINVEGDLSYIAPNINEIVLTRSRTGKTFAAARFGAVDFVQWAAHVKGVDYEDPDGEAEALAYLNAHQGVMTDYLEKHGVEMPSEYDWDDSVLVAKTELDSNVGVTWASAAAALDSAPNSKWVIDGLTNPDSEMSRGLQAACANHRP